MVFGIIPECRSASLRKERSASSESSRRPEAVRELAREILAAHFPESLHRSITSAIGLELEATTRGSGRDSEFRRSVVAAWGHRCAFCGYAVQLDNADLGLEAAHIRWCQFGGPDTTDNGLACCSIHHQAFDRGAITISDQLLILVSSRLHGSGKLDDLFLTLHGAPLPRPSLKAAQPRREFLQWHRAEVFRGMHEASAGAGSSGFCQHAIQDSLHRGLISA